MFVVFIFQTDDHGPFSDLRVLEVRPAHMSVFLNYLMSTPSTDPSPTVSIYIHFIFFVAVLDDLVQD